MMNQLILFKVTKGMRGKLSGNVLFWWGLMAGVPLITVLYLYSDEDIAN